MILTGLANTVHLHLVSEPLPSDITSKLKRPVRGLPADYPLLFSECNPADYHNTQGLPGARHCFQNEWLY